MRGCVAAEIGSTLQRCVLVERFRAVKRGRGSRGWERRCWLAAAACGVRSTCSGGEMDGRFFDRAGRARCRARRRLLVRSKK